MAFPSTDPLHTDPFVQIIRVSHSRKGTSTGSGVELVYGVNGQQAPLCSKREEVERWRGGQIREREETETVLLIQRRAVPNQGIGHWRK